MAQAYTPGLKRKELCIVRKTRSLPLKGEILVKVGDRVSSDIVVARTSVPGNPVFINVAMVLQLDEPVGLDSRSVYPIKKMMLKQEGEQVEKGECLAVHKYFFGLGKTVCLAPSTAIVERISELSGQVILREPPTPVEVKAYIPSIVTDVTPNEAVILETPATFIQGILGIGGETWGELMVAVKSTDEILTAEKIGSEMAGKILVGGALVDYNALKKAVEVGVKGIVTGGMNQEDLTRFMGYELGVAITGHEEVGLTLIIMEGFGRIRMAEKTFALLKEREGMLTCINGATQIRAGVMRPEIIIPRHDLDPSDELIPDDASAYSEGMIAGTPIRVIRDPNFGALGKVISLPVELQRLETGSMARVLEAELDDGRHVMIPRANVEIVEE